MKIGIIGPSDIPGFCRLLNLKDYETKVLQIAGIVAKSGHSIVIVPHKDSVSELFALKYKEEAGSKVICIVPLDDLEFGTEMLNHEISDEVMNAGSWRNVPETLDENSDILLCLGFGPGSLIEICQTKWFKVKKILVVSDFISQKLPSEVNARLPIDYIGFSQVESSVK
jgi:hypothetical protein